MIKEEFSYGYYDLGQRKKFRLTLPFNPLLEGFRLAGRENCCMHFRKGKYLLKVRASTMYVFLYDRNWLNKGRTYIRSHASFKKMLEDAMDSNTKPSGN
jgi:hypothetical protein